MKITLLYTRIKVSISFTSDEQFRLEMSENRTRIFFSVLKSKKRVQLSELR